MSVMMIPVCIVPLSGLYVYTSIRSSLGFVGVFNLGQTDFRRRSRLSLVWSILLELV